MPELNTEKPNTRIKTADFKALVQEETDLNEPHVAYEFTGRTFKETNQDGIYSDDS